MLEVAGRHADVGRQPRRAALDETVEDIGRCERDRLRAVDADQIAHDALRAEQHARRIVMLDLPVLLDFVEPQKAGVVVEPQRRARCVAETTARGGNVDPCIVMLREQRRELAVLDGEERQVLLLAREHDERQGALRRPARAREVWILREVPRDPRRCATGEVHDAEVDDRVRPTRARILERRRRLLGMTRIRDVERVHRSVVGALKRDLFAVG
jgi:hypothetical protein